jgi:hypothetical protein
MPKVHQQKPPTTTRNSTPISQSKSVLERIVPVEVEEGAGLKLLIYGRSKTGKTRLACTFPKPLLVIGTEKGTKSVATVKGIDFVRIWKQADIAPLVLTAAEGKSYWKNVGGKLVQSIDMKDPKQPKPMGDPYISVVVDTAGGLQDLILKEVLGVAELPIQRSWGMAKRDDWMATGAQTKEQMSKILGLSESHNLNIIVIAHERNFGDDEVVGEIMTPSVGPALTPSITGWLNGAADYIGQMFIREEVKRKTLDIKGEKVTTEHKTGKKEFCLRTGPHPIYTTGFRLPPEIELPDAIIDPSYAKIVALVNGEQP